MKQNRFVILISGKQRSGKNDSAYLINRHLGFRLRPVSLAQPIKELYASKNNMTLDDVELLKNTKPDVRRALIEISKDYKARDIDYWTNKVLEYEGHLIVPDLRFQHELRRFLEASEHALTIRVVADRPTREARGVLSNEDDPSETDLDAYEDWDYIIYNDGSRAKLDQQCQIIADSIDDYMTAAKAY